MSPLAAYENVTISTTHGDAAGRYYASPVATRGIVWIGGMGGFWDGPAGDLYTHLAESFQRDDIASLRLNVRCPTNMDESIADTLAGITFLWERRIRGIGLVGHSFAGAVAIRAAVYSTLPTTVVTLAVQSQGAEIVGQLPPHCSLLLIHGTADEVLHMSNSEYVAALAHQPKQLRLFPGAKHTLDGAADDIHHEVDAWLRAHVRPAALALPQAS